MFRAISFLIQSKHDVSNPLDIGSLVECMLFYEKTIVVANYKILEQLIRYFGGDNLIILIEEGFLDITYTESFVGVHTKTISNIQYHDPIEFSSPQHTFEREIRKICIEVTGKDGKGRRLARRLESKIQVSQHDRIILEGAQRSILDQNYIERAARTIVKNIVSEAEGVSNIFFNTVKTNDGIKVDTNIDFVSLNQLYHKKVPPEHSTLTPAYILSHVLDVEKELYFSSSNFSELASSQLSAKLASQKIDYVIERSKKSSETLNHFTAFVFDDAKALKEAINSGNLDLDEIISVIRKSKKFKKWIADIKPSSDLIKSYYKEVTKETIVDKLPGKSVRWGLFTGLGFAVDVIAAGGIGTVAGVTLGALDTFYFDKLLSGWKPSQFIDEDIKKLINKGR